MLLAEPIQIGGRRAPNRFAALPMEANDAAPDGTPSPRTIERYSNLARGGWGVIMVEAIAPNDTGRARARQLVLTEENLPYFQQLIDAMRAIDDRTLIFLQLNHAGRYALRPGIAYHHPQLDGQPGISKNTPQLTTAKLDAARRDMAALAELATRTGADGADLKCCHGYLGIELLRPANTRSDRYGGVFENRSRLMRAMLDAAAPAARDNDFLIGARVSLFEGCDGGLGDDGPETEPPSEDIRLLLEMLRDGGASWLCETAGNPYFNPEMSRPIGKDARRFETMKLHHRLAARVKKHFPGFTVIGTGYTLFGAEFISVAEENIRSGRVDLIGFSRQNFADPETPKKILGGDPLAVRWCRACAKNNCAQLLRSGQETGCAVYKNEHEPLR